VIAVDEDLELEVELFGERARRWRQLEVWHSVHDARVAEEGHRRAIWEADTAEWEMQRPRREEWGGCGCSSYGDYCGACEGFDEAYSEWLGMRP
jgi:hypothetical protein